MAGQHQRIQPMQSLVEWAVRSMDAGHLLELPREFKGHIIGPWR